MDNFRPKNDFSTLVRENATKSNALEIPKINLPKGGGALKGIDEKFSINPSNGTSGMNIPLPVTPGRNGLNPVLSLSYNSGAGKSPFGLGWDLHFPTVQRKTDKQLPKYNSGTVEDVFMISGAEDLVPYLEEREDLEWTSIERHTQGYSVKRYRPRLEGDFSKIEQIIHEEHGVYWKVTSKDNTVTFLGQDEKCRISDPTDKEKIFQWLPEISFDDRGNWIWFEYKEENLDKVPDTLHEKNRKSGTAAITNKYLKRVKYGNRNPWYRNPAKPYEYDLSGISGTEYFFEIVFDYGEHDVSRPTPEEEKGALWEVRCDPFSHYRAGFEIRTYRLCQRILFFHHFEELGKEPCLVRSMDFTYLPQYDENYTLKPLETTCLTSITQNGYIRKPDGSYSKKSLPSMDFIYQQLLWNTSIKNVNKESLVHSPVGISQEYQWVDLYNEGIPGIFSEQDGEWYYKSNLGDIYEDGIVRFTQTQLVTGKPSFNGINQGVVQFQDLEGNGKKQLVIHQPGVQGFLEMSGDGNWLPFQAFAQMVNINMDSPQVKLIDMDGDGLPDILVSEENAFLCYASRGKEGYAPPEHAGKAFNEEQGPVTVFAHGQEAICLADMNGDGLADILRVRNGEVCYWPNLGYGRFGAKVTMDNSPFFDYPELFDPKKVYLADFSGTGATDLLYWGGNQCRAWINLSGNEFSETFEIKTGFPMEGENKISVVDILGKGTSCLVWSSSLPSYSSAPMRYIDLTGGKKPHVMVKYLNNMGKETSLEYKSSTWYYLKDKLEDRPWITKLPFPVHCMSKIETVDRISDVRFTTEYFYHHGYFDQEEREFRGFGMVEQKDCEKYATWKMNNAGNRLDKSEEVFQKPVLVKTWYHTGAFLDKDKIFTCFEEEYWYNEMTRRGFTSPIEHAIPDAGIIPVDTIRNPEFMSKLTAGEWREAFRACKGMVLRQEVFALDAPEDGATEDEIIRELTPYTVAMNNCTIRVMQPRRHNRHAVFHAVKGEELTYHYERNPEDPRITHTLNTLIDEYGNMVESASISYARVSGGDTLPADVQAVIKEEQEKNYIIYTKNCYTKDVNDTEAAYRLRLPCESRTYEITRLPKEGALYQIEEFKDIFGQAAGEIPYQSEEAGSGSKPGRRLIECIRTLYYKDDLTEPLLLGQLGAAAITYESRQLAYTQDLLQDLFGGKADQALMKEGGFQSGEGDSWWITSGTIQYIDINAGEDVNTARARFYTPVSYTDPLGTLTKAKYYKDYYLLLEEVEDALHNRTRVEAFNFRTLAPCKMKDMNDNLSELIADELGIVKALAVMGKDTDGDGKGDEGDDLDGLKEYYPEEELANIDNFFLQEDSIELHKKGRVLLNHATVRYVYDFDCYKKEGKPAVITAIKRVKHYHEETDPENALIRLSFEYSDGLGRVVMTKAQSEPGKAKKLDTHADGTATVIEIDTAAQNPKRLRWVGSGRVVLNNKGNPVKQYEPYFSVSSWYEDGDDLVAAGQTPILYYDTPGRLVKTEYPDKTFSKVEYSAWKQVSYDRNDTVKDSKWYEERRDGKIDAQLMDIGKDPMREKEAAQKASEHDKTPMKMHFDTLGRPILMREHTRNKEGKNLFYLTKVVLDIEGNAREVIDARGNTVMGYKYDMLGHRVYQKSMDSGGCWTLNNVMGNPVRQWDGRNRVFSFLYDVLHRPTEKNVSGGDDSIPLNNTYEKIIYGEGQKDDKLLNLRGKPWIHYDTAGKILLERYDFKGNSQKSVRRFALKYKETVNWNVQVPDVMLEAEEFTEKTAYDAINRVIESTTPDGSITRPVYNEAGLLEAVNVTQKESTESYVKNINYNEKGQRTCIEYGNGIQTSYEYDKETYRLLHLKTVKPGNTLLQDLYYTYDPVGNITHILDKAVPIIFFDNQKIEGAGYYEYDALYRLVKATGREHRTQTDFGCMDNWNDIPFLKQYSSSDPLAWRNYTQYYKYDAVGNIEKMEHLADGAGWSRDYTYETDNNRLKGITVGDNAYTYPHEVQHGLMIGIPHLPLMQWNFKDELSAVSGQRRTDGGTPETTYYVYDFNGQRVRKVTENAADKGKDSVKKCERLYIGGFEVYREHSGTYAGLERKALHVMDGTRRIALIETRNDINDGSPQRLIRYQFSNHLGSACLETDGDARVICYEEYHPYGTTAYQAVNKDIKAAAKRYRYTGKERDEESGFYYYGARYYAPWLGRWTAADPAGLAGGINAYAYVSGNPIKYTDPTGHAQKSFDEMTPEERVKATASKQYIESMKRGGGGTVNGARVNPSGEIGTFYSEREKKIDAPPGLLAHLPGFKTGWALMEATHGETATGKTVSRTEKLLEAAGSLAVDIMDVQTLGEGGVLLRGLGSAGKRFLMGRGRDAVVDTGAALLRRGADTEVKHLVETKAAKALTKVDDVAPGVSDATKWSSDKGIYEVGYRAQLKKGVDYPGVSDSRHFQEANRQLHEAFQADPAFAQRMEEIYPGIVDGVKPGSRGAFPRKAPTQDVTWHHHPYEEGAMDLMPYDQHTAKGPIQEVLHPDNKGGMERWGGGRKRTK